MVNIKINGARVHNLKNIDVDILRNKINVLVGVSGSGKSTIAYDIVAAEGQRQFLESISTFAARLLKANQKPDIDSIENLSPTIAINQKKLRGSPRSTVGTSTEIYTYLRLLFSRFGSVKGLDAAHFSFNSPQGACPDCKGIGREYSIDPKSVLDYSKSLNDGASRHNLFRPGSRYFQIIKASGRLDMDKPVGEYSEKELDFLLYSPKVLLRGEYGDAVQKFTHRGIIVALMDRAKDNRGQSNYKKKSDGVFWKVGVCGKCHGGRLNERTLGSVINGKNIGDYSNMELSRFVDEIGKIDIVHAGELKRRIIEIAGYLIDVDLGYLSLNRGLDSLSGGESQRLKLARELGSDLIEMVYVLDEPTAGLHPKDIEKLVKILQKLKEAGNTVIVVEHDKEVMRNADNIIEVGPGAGREGGEITFEGSFDELKDDDSSISGEYLGKVSKTEREVRRPEKYLEIKNASKNNLKGVNVKIPLNVFCAVSGLSGSGKSSLIMDEFVNQFSDEDIVIVDQLPLTGSARGNIATYSGVFDNIRKIFAEVNGVNASLFSSNSKGGCPGCKGLGFNKIDMHFMDDVRVKCEVCKGKKYTEEVLNYSYKGKNIDEVLEMTVNEAFEFFREDKIRDKLKILKEVGLGYLTLGQTHDTFSGGEAQRLKLASRLGDKGKIFVLDEPTTGLHFHDVKKLLRVLDSLVEKGNTMVVIEHNLDVIKSSDYIIDLGPEGGEDGGEVVATGTPEEIVKIKGSWTGKYLRKVL